MPVSVCIVLAATFWKYQKCFENPRYYIVASLLPHPKIKHESTTNVRAKQLHNRASDTVNHDRGIQKPSGGCFSVKKLFPHQRLSGEVCLKEHYATGLHATCYTLYWYDVVSMYLDVINCTCTIPVSSIDESLLLSFCLEDSLTETKYTRDLAFHTGRQIAAAPNRHACTVKVVSVAQIGGSVTAETEALNVVVPIHAVQIVSVKRIPNRKGQATSRSSIFRVESAGGSDACNTDQDEEESKELVENHLWITFLGAFCHRMRVLGAQLFGFVRCDEWLQQAITCILPKAYHLA